MYQTIKQTALKFLFLKPLFLKCSSFKILPIFFLLMNFIIFNYSFSKNLNAQTVGTFVDANYAEGKYSTLSNFDGTPNFTNRTYSGDISVFTYNHYVYLLEVASTSRIYKFSIDDTNTDLFTYNEENGYPLDQANGILSNNLCNGSFASSGSNPISISFVSDTKAYLVLYNYNKILIVNPSASDFSNFKIGEIDFSSYADSDACPETRSVNVIGNKAYFSLQLLNRNNGWTAENDAKILVVNTNTDSVEKELTITGFKNPNSEIKIKDNKIFISFQGPSYPVDESFGGLISIDNNNSFQNLFYQELLTNNAVTHFDFYNNDLYFLHYKDWGDISLEKFNINNPQTPSFAFGFDGDLNLFGLLIAQDKLWLLDRSSSNGGFHIVNLANETVSSYILSTYLPYSITYNDNTTSIKETNVDNKLMVYPNPAKNLINFKLLSPADKIEITSIAGQTIKTIKNTKQSFSLEISDLNRGIYLIKVIKDNKVFVQKLLID